MKISSLFFLLLFSFNLYANTYSFVDRPLKIVVLKEKAKVTFLMRATSYLVETNSQCFQEIEQAIKDQLALDVTFSPRDLKLDDCKVIN